ASRRPARLPGGERAARRALRRPGRLGAEGHPQRGGVGQVLERPDDRRVRRRDLEREALYRDVAMAAISPLAGEPIVACLTTAPGNDAPIGGLKIVVASGGSRHGRRARRTSTRSTRRASGARPTSIPS